MRKAPPSGGRRVLFPFSRHFVSGGPLDEESQDERRSDDDSVITILTNVSWEHDETPPPEADQDRITKGSLQHKFAKLQKVFDKRDRMLDRLANAQNPALIAVLRKREIIVRQQERELLLLHHLDTQDCDDADDSSLGSNEDSTVWHEAKEIPTKDAAPVTAKAARGLPHPTYSTTATTDLIESIYDAMLFEYRIVAPAVASLFIHSLAHAGLYDAVEVFCLEFRKACGYYWLGNQRYHEYIEYGILCGLGLCMIRSSGYLYWWLNIQDYNLVKLDLHNRLRLGFWGARCMVWVKRRPVLRALLFMVGYNICYQIMFDTYEKWYYSFMRNKAMEDDIDDIQRGETPCLDDFALSVAQSCLTLQPESGLGPSATVPNEFEYVWESRYLKTFEWFWKRWMEAIIEPASDPILSVLVFLSVTCTCVFVLNAYGFEFFGKY